MSYRSSNNIRYFQVNNELYEDTLQPQYLSVDLTEVELVENDNGPRENNSVLLDVSTYYKKSTILLLVYIIIVYYIIAKTRYDLAKRRRNGIKRKNSLRSNGKTETSNLLDNQNF